MAELTNFQKVQQFNRAFDMVTKEPKNYLDLANNLSDEQKYFQYARLPNEKTIKLRLDLIEEEVKELETAIEQNDFKETRDAIADILYVVYGMADVFALPIDNYFQDKIKTHLENETDLIEKINENNSNFDSVTLMSKLMFEKFTNIIEIDSFPEKVKACLKNILKTFKLLKSVLECDDIKPNGYSKWNLVIDYIYILLKYVYIMAIIYKINADADFAIVHDSNMSKLCDNEDDAAATVADYTAKFAAGSSPYDSPYYYYLPDLDKWIIKNKSTGKALKNIKYKQVAF